MEGVFDGLSLCDRYFPTEKELERHKESCNECQSAITYIREKANTIMQEVNDECVKNLIGCNTGPIAEN